MIRKLFLTFLCFFIFSKLDAQFSDIQLALDFVIYQNDTLCKFDAKGNKTGNWIEYELNNTIEVLNNDFCTVINDNLHSDNYTTEFYSRTKTRYDSNCDSVFTNIVPGSLIKHLDIGEYKNGLKEGKWERVNEKGNVIALINYCNGDAYGDFNYYYDNGKIKISGQIDTINAKVNFYRYDTNSNIVDNKVIDYDTFKAILR